MQNRARVQALTPIEGAEPRFDDEGREIVEVATCGTCGRSWNDAAVSSLTPVPAGRCPFEYEHEDDEEHAELSAEYLRGVNDALNLLVEYVGGDYGQNIAASIEEALCRA